MAASAEGNIPSGRKKDRKLLKIELIKTCIGREINFFTGGIE